MGTGSPAPGGLTGARKRPIGLVALGAALLPLWLPLAPVCVGAEAAPLEVPTETFRPAGRVAAADSVRVVQRAPVLAERVVELPPPAESELRAADAEAAARADARHVVPVSGGAEDGAPGASSAPERPVLKVHRAGIGRDLRELPGGTPDSAALTWLPTADGGRATALAVVSEGAGAVRVKLIVEGAPDGLEIRVFDASGTASTVEPVPPHQLRSTAGSGVEAEVWTPSVRGEALTVELYLPPGTPPGELRVSIPTLSHLDADPKVLGHIGRARCPHVDAACAADRISDASRRSVAKYLYTSGWGGTYLCTGQLLNDADPSTQVPYFVTARHCVGNAREAASMEFYWFFERAACGGPDPTTVTRQTGGATELANAALDGLDNGVDHLLVRLNTDPPAGAGLAGWTTSPAAADDTPVGVHHPAGDLKKITSQDMQGFRGWNRIGSSHIHVRPEVNTEGGSSGSGIWVRRDGAYYLAGVLTGGSRGCTNADDYYGRWDRFYPRVSQWLGSAERVTDSDIGGVARLVLVDAATRVEVAGLGGGATLDLDTVAIPSFDIVAELDGRVGSVSVALTGPRTASHSSDLPPYSAFGPGGGGGLVAGEYRARAVAYREPGTQGVRLLELDAPLTVTGGGGGAMAVSGLSLAVGAAPRIVELRDNAAVTVYAGEKVEVRARTSGGGAVGSVGFALTGAGTLSATANEVPFAVPAELVSGTYGIAVTPYAGAEGEGRAGTPLALSGVTVTVVDTPAVSGFTLVDQDGRPADANVAALTDGAEVDLAARGGWASVLAELAASAGATRVELDLRGPRGASRTVTVGGPVSLFGERDGSHVLGAFINGAYRLTATPYTGPGPRDALPGTTVSFTVTGGLENAVTGFTVIDAGGPAPDPDFVTVADGAAVDLGEMTTASASIRADLVEPGLVGSVRLELRGPVSVTRTENEAPYLLFGGAGDDVFGGALPNGTYTLTARPFAERDGGGTALPPRTVTFTVTDSVWPQTRVTGFTLVDAAGGTPDPDIGPIGQDAAIYVPDLAGGEYSIRADLSDVTGVGSVRLRLSGPVLVSRTEANDGSPFTIFGDNPTTGDVYGRPLPAGRYQAEATPFSGPHGGGDSLVTQTVSFTLSRYDPDVAPVAGFALVDAGSDADTAAVTDGTTVDTSGAGGGVNIRAEIAPERLDVRSVAFELRGPREVTRIDGGRPFSLFGDDDRAAADYAGSALPNGDYTLTARPYRGPDGGGDALAEATVSFTVSGSHDADASAVAGFTLVDAAGGLPDPDLGAIEEGGIVDMSVAWTGSVSVRAEMAERRVDVGSMVFELRGPRDVTHVDDGRPFSLFGDDGAAEADYAGSALPNGAYTLTARPYTQAGGKGDALPVLAKSFTVTRSHAVTAAPLTGFTLLDAAGGADAVLGTVADGATLDLSSSATGAVTVRAEPAARRTDAQSVVFELRGPRDVDRTVDAGVPWRLFGPDGGVLPNGTYTLTARPYTGPGGTGDALPATAVTFTVTGSHDAGAPAVTGFTLVDAAGGPPDPDLGALADRAAVDLSATGGFASVRAELAAKRPDVQGVTLSLRGPLETDRTAPPAAPVSLFGDEAGDYVAGPFPDGDYTLTAVPLIGRSPHSDDFGGGAAGWTEHGGDWTAADGVYRAAGGGESKASLDGLEAPDLVLAADVRPMSGYGSAGVIFRVRDPRAGRDDFRGYYAGVGDGRAVLGRMDGGSFVELGRTGLDFGAGRRYRLRVTATGPAIRLHVDRKLLLEAEDATYAGGAVGLRSWRTGAEWDNVEVRPLDAGSETAVAFTVTGGVPTAVTGFTLIDAGGPAPDPDFAVVEDGGTLSLAGMATDSQSIRADTAERSSAGSIRLELRGPVSVTRTAGGAPHLLFGGSGGDAVGGALPDGTYTLTARPFTAAEGGGQALPETSATFTLTDSPRPQTRVTGFTLVDAAGGLPEPDIGPIVDDATVYLSRSRSPEYSIRAEIGDLSGIGSVRLRLSGPVTAQRVENNDGSPFTVFGDDARSGDIRGRRLPPGEYYLEATPFAEPHGNGASRTAQTVAFSLREPPLDDDAVTGFTFVDAATDADAGVLAAGAAVDVSSLTDGTATIRADVPAARSDVRSMAFVLRGPRNVERTDDGPPFSLFGDDGGAAADYAGRALPNGAYTLSARPYDGRDGTGAGLKEKWVSFTVTGGPPSPVTGLTLIDAAEGSADAALVTIADGATLDLSSAATGAVTIRAEVSADVGSVVFELRGPREFDRTVDAGTPWRLFGPGGGTLPNGTYTLTVRPYGGAGGTGRVFAETTVTFTVTGSYDPGAPAVTGFTLVDAAGGLPDPDLGALADGAAVDLSATDGFASIRAELAPRRPDVKSVVLALRGPLETDRAAPAAAPVSLFGDDGGDYAAGAFPNGAYTLTAQPYAGPGGTGDALPETAVAFRVTGSGAGPVTGFTLLDAAEGSADAVLGAIADGAALDLSSAATGAVTVRAELAEDIGSMVFELRGPLDVDRTVDAGTPWRLFGPGGGVLPNGAYTLTARPYAGPGGTGDAFRETTVTFTVTGSHDAGAPAVTGFTLVDAAGGLPDPDLGALADGAAVDLSATDGLASIRAELAPRRPDVQAIAMALRGPVTADRTARSTAPVSLFGDDGGDYVAGEFPTGPYTLTARPLVWGATRVEGFTGGAQGWTEYGGTWRAADGVYGVSAGTGVSHAALDGFEASDVVVEADVRTATELGTAGVIFRVSDPRPAGFDGFRGYYAGVGGEAGGGAVFARMEPWGIVQFQRVPLEFEPGRQYRLRVTAKGPAVRVYVDGALLMRYDNRIDVAGAVGLHARRAQAEWDNVTVRRLDGEPDAALPATAVAFTVTGGMAGPVTGFTLLDAAEGSADEPLGAIADGAVLDLSSSATGAVTVRAELGEDVGSVVFELRGPLDADRTVDAGAPWRLFGPGGGVLPNGTYTLTARPYAGPGGTGDALPGTTVTFTVTGSHDVGAPAVTGFTLVDAAGGLPDPDLGALADGLAVDLSATDGFASIRAELAPRRPDVQAIAMALRGPVTADRTVPAEAPVSLFGGDGGDYAAGPFPDGAYTLTARPYAGPGGAGDALPETTVAFTVTGGTPGPVTGFTLVDAAGGLPDPDLGPLADGAAVDLSATSGHASIRAELEPRWPGVRSVVLALRGPLETNRAAPAVAPVSLFGDDGGDYAARVFPNGAYTLTARPLKWTASHSTGFGDGAVGWTEHDGTWAAADGIYKAFGDGDGDESKATLDGFAASDVVVEADVRPATAAGDAGVVFRVTDPERAGFRGYYAGVGGGGAVLGRMDVARWVELDRAALEFEPGRQYRLRVTARGSAIRVHIDGELLLEADDATHSDGVVGLRSRRAGAEWDNVTAGRLDGDPDAALPETTVAFTVTDWVAGPVTGFTLLDAAEGASDAVLDAIADGAALDLSSSATGAVTVSAELGEDVGSVVFELRGPRDVDRTVDAGTPWRLFGLGGAVLPNGAYTLTARPYSGPGGTGDALRETTVTFTVAGSHDPGAPAVTGFTLVDAADGLPDPDLGAIADGAAVNLAATGGLASIRAELAPRRPDVQAVALVMTGPWNVDRTVAAKAPVSLLGDEDGDYAAGAFPDGAYRLTARPLAGRASAFADGAPGWTAHAGSWTASDGVYRAAGVGESKASLDGFHASDVLLEADVRLTAESGDAGIVYRMSDPQPGPNAFRGYYAGIGGGRAVLARMDGGNHEELGQAALDHAVNRWYRLGVRAKGTTMRLYVDGELLLEADDATHAAGAVGLRTWRTDAEWDNVTATVLDGDADAALPATTVAFTVTGGVQGAVTGFTLLDAAAGSADTVLGAIADGAALDLSSSATGAVTIRAELGEDVGSVVFELRGPLDVDRTVDAGTPWRLFGPGGGALPNGAYTLTARPYAGPGGTGAALPATAVTFTVTGSHDAGAPAVTGFTLVDAAGGLPDPDLGALADGAAVDLSATGGLASIRAELAPRRPDVKSVALALRGPLETDRAAPAAAPVSLFGDAGGDYVAGAFPEGAYTLTARPLEWTASHSEGFVNGAGRWTEHGGTWTAADGVYGVAAGGGDSKASLDGFEASDLVLEADVRVTAAAGNAGVMFRVSDPRPGRDAFRGYYAGVGDGRAVLGRMDQGRWRQLGRAALAVEADRWYRLRVRAVGPTLRVYVDGELLLQARDATYAGGAVGLRSWRTGAGWDNVTAVRLDGDPGAALPETAVAFRVTGSGAGPVTGFTLLDAAEGSADAVLGAIADGAALDLSSAATGAVTVRAELAEDIGSMVFELRGPLDVDRTVDAGTPWRLFGPGGGVLPNGAYTLTARPYAGPGGTGDAFRETTVTFTVTGSHDAGAPAVTGFTLVDAAGGLPDPDLGALADGAAVDLSATDGLASIRVELAPRRPDVKHVVLALRGPLETDRAAPAAAPVSLFGDAGGDYIAGAFPEGAYRLTAWPLGWTASHSEGFDDGAGRWTEHGGRWTAADGVYGMAAARDGGKALLDGFKASDLVLEADVRVTTTPGNAGVIFRVSDPRPAGFDGFRGYYAGVGDGAVVLGRMDQGDWWRLGRIALAVEADRWYRLRVRAMGPNLGVYVDGDLLLKARDATYAGGAVGLLGLRAEAAWDDVAIHRLDGDAAPPEATVGFTVRGPPPVLPPLTGRFERLPARHSGAGTTFTFRVAFSEPIGILSYVEFRDAALTIGNGEVTSVARVREQTDLWDVTVAPASPEDVVLAIAADRPCGETGAVCTADGRRLSVPVEATVRGPLRTATVAADTATVVEGTPATFTVSLDRAAVAPMAVAIAFSETGAMLAEGPPAEVSFAAGEQHVAVAAPTVDDAVVEAGSVVTATLAGGSEYVLGSAATASVDVSDDDEAEFTVTADPARITEGGSAVVTAAIVNGVTFADDRRVTLEVSGAASAADYDFTQEEDVLAAGATTVTARLDTIDDGRPEPDEAISVSAVMSGDIVASATLTIAESPDTRLKSLALSGLDIGPFDGALRVYTAEAPGDLAATAVTAIPSDAAAGVVIEDAAGSTAGTSRTSSLEPGRNDISVTVTSPDGTVSWRYSVTVIKGYPWGDRTPERDIVLAPGTQAKALWGDGETLWVMVDWRGETHAYDLSNGERLEARDKRFGGGSGDPMAMWSDGGTLWVADYGGALEAYRFSDGSRLAESDFGAATLSAAGNESPAGLWSDGTTMWVSDYGDGKAYAYRMADGERAAARDFDLLDIRVEGTLGMFGLWSDGTTVLSSYWQGGSVRGYRLADGARLLIRDIATSGAGNARPRDLWSDGSTLWVSDANETRLYAYDVSALSLDRDAQRRLDAGAVRVPAGTAAEAPPANRDDPAADPVEAGPDGGPDLPPAVRRLPATHSVPAAGGVRLVGGATAGAILLDGLDCGGEGRLPDCAHGGVGTRNCTHREDAGVACGAPPPALVAAVAAGDVLTLVFDGLLADARPAPGDFAVTLEGAPLAVAAVTVAGRSVRLRLGRPVSPAARVEASYLGAAFDPLRGASGAPVAPAYQVPVRILAGAPPALPEPGARRASAEDGPAAKTGAARVLAELADFPDAGLAAALRDALTARPRADGLADLWVLDAAGRGIVSLDGIGRASGLRALDLSDNAVVDIAPLAALPRLRRLDLGGNAVPDLGALSGLRELRRLRLDGNRIEDMGPLRELAALEVLLLRDNAVADIGAVLHLAALESLDLSGNRVRELEPLADLTRLRRLGLAGNPAVEVSPLGDVGSLVWLDLSGTPVGGAQALGRLAALRWLWGDAATRAAVPMRPAEPRLVRGAAPPGAADLPQHRAEQAPSP